MNTTTRCHWCGQPHFAEVIEAWGHEVLIDACCDLARQELIEDAQDPDPEVRRPALEQLAPAGLLPWNSRRLAENGAGGLVLDYQLRVAPSTLREVQRFVGLHHRHCAPPQGWRAGAAVYNGPTLVGVVALGRPVARMLDQRAVAEVTRLCIDPALPQPLVWNAASMLYGWAARTARKLGAEHVITYTLDHESGTTLRAAGFEPDGVTRAHSSGRDWSRAGRAPKTSPGTRALPAGAKIRWRRQLVSKPRYVLRNDPTAASAALRLLSSHHSAGESQLPCAALGSQIIGR